MTCQNVGFAQFALDALNVRYQQVVTALVVQRIVDLLQVVAVDQQQAG